MTGKVAPGIGDRGFSPTERAFFIVLVLLPLLPLWSVSLFPSQDGPVHLEIAAFLRQLAGDPAPHAERYLAFNSDPEPNWAIYPLLTLLLGAVSAPSADKILVSAYLVMLPLAMLYALRGLRRGASWMALLGLPLVLNYPLHMGFYNFVFGLGAFFATFGYRERCAVPMRPLQAAGLALLLLLAYFCHLVAFAMAVLWTGLATLTDVALQARQGSRSAQQLLAVAAGPAAATLPAAVLAASFLGEQGVGEVQRMGLGSLVRHLGVFYSLVSYGRAEMVASAALLALLMALSAAVLWRRWAGVGGLRWRRHDSILGAAGLSLLLYFVAPIGVAGGGYLNQRLQLFVIFFALLWLGAQPEADRHRRTATTGGAALAVAFAAIYGAHYVRLERYLDEYLSPAHLIQPQTTLLPLSFSHRGDAPGRRLSRKVSPFEHASGHLVAERRLVDLNLFQAGRGYFPIVYRPQCDPYTHLGSVEQLSAEWPDPDLGGYRNAPGCRIDYVLVWGADDAARVESPLFQQLDEGFDEIFVSRRGLTRLYRRRDWQ